CAKDSRPDYHYGSDYFTDGLDSW
nr:immunoglobulin heavy chain junction region [Macaca mulatta]MOY22100.1 immunoglobulin heavy chain junction region [Macaca mulatta]MOY22357.1 immunoglobulin heavy chain junction region [Macaca mulatta]MOY22430.1 immunoglobulin heavy chain junction region [Macaca mulatta]MOY22584.1 immunoglobulin heavy chain junction region [Macaca mulatta]